MKKRANRNTKATYLFLSSILATSSAIAIDLESIYAEHAEYCMTHLNTEERNLFERLFNAEITEECVRDAIKKTGQAFDAFFFENEISDEEYRQELAKLEALSDKKLPANLKKEIGSAVERHSIISAQDKPSGDTLPTAPGFTSVGVQASENK